MTKDRWENTVWDTDVYLDDIDGKEPMTNEDWLRTCSTEELAEFIRKQRDDWSDGWYSDCHRFEEILEWLKQPHTPKE